MNAGPTAAGRSSQAASVLIVDDTIENLRLLAGLLSERGYEARPVSSGAQALLAADHAPPDIILLDVSMPEMDGYQVCERLKLKVKLREIPVIFLTSLADTADKLKAFGAGAADYITKPFQVDEVLARVKVHVELRAARLEIERRLEQLRALERLRDDLVNMVVHDMRSPLMVLLMHLDFLKEPVSGLGREPQEDLLIAATATAGLSRMANDLLDVSRMEEGKMPLARSKVDLVETAGAVRDSLAALDRTRTLEVDAAGAAAIHASCDGSLVKRVIENLVGNAIKHTPSGGSVRIAVARGRGTVRVDIHDQGPGVPVEARERIFEKFGTLSSRNEHGVHSAGLGLAFCKMAVEAHGGRIGVKPGDPSGSDFWFELPE